MWRKTSLGWTPCGMTQPTIGVENPSSTSKTTPSLSSIGKLFTLQNMELVGNLGSGRSRRGTCSTGRCWEFHSWCGSFLMFFFLGSGQMMEKGHSRPILGGVLRWGGDFGLQEHPHLIGSTTKGEEWGVGPKSMGWIQLHFQCHILLCEEWSMACQD